MGQNYHFSFMPKIIRILRSCSMKIFYTVNISKLNFWLVICIAKNFIWTTLKMIFSIFRFFCTLRFQFFKYCPIITNHTSMESYLFSVQMMHTSQFRKINTYDWFLCSRVTYNDHIALWNMIVIWIYIHMTAVNDDFFGGWRNSDFLAFAFINLLFFFFFCSELRSLPDSASHRERQLWEGKTTDSHPLSMSVRTVVKEEFLQKLVQIIRWRLVWSEPSSCYCKYSKRLKSTQNPAALITLRSRYLKRGRLRFTA